MADDSSYRTFHQLAEHLQQSSTNHVFAMQGTNNVVMTSARDRDDPKEVTVHDDAGDDAFEKARIRGERDLDDFSDLPEGQRKKQIQQMSDFVHQQRLEVVRAWQREGLPDVFNARAQALLDGDDSEKFRTSAAAFVGEVGTKGWDENIQTEIVASRIEGRETSLAKHAGKDSHADLLTMHQLLAESSSLTRTPTGVVGGSLDAFEDSGAAAAHPGPRKLNKGSEMGNGVGASPKAHMLRTGVMQAFEEQAMMDGANIAERQIARVLMARRATTNAFEAPDIEGTTNRVFHGSARREMIQAGREIDKASYDHLRTFAIDHSSDNFRQFLGKRTKESSPPR